MRPPMGAGSHQQPNPKASSMGFIMPLYTIGIVAFFIYTIMKLVCKKSPTTPYEPVKPDQKFREKVFEKDDQHDPLINRPDDGTTKLGKSMSMCNGYLNKCKYNLSLFDDIYFSNFLLNNFKFI